MVKRLKYFGNHAQKEAVHLNPEVISMVASYLPINPRLCIMAVKAKPTVSK
jgi:hypothetical protein